MTLESIAPLSDGVPHHAAHSGSLNVPALPAGSRVERNALTARAGTRSSKPDPHPEADLDRPTLPMFQATGVLSQ